MPLSVPNPHARCDMALVVNKVLVLRQQRGGNDLPRKPMTSMAFHDHGQAGVSTNRQKCLP